MKAQKRWKLKKTDKYDRLLGISLLKMPDWYEDAQGNLTDNRCMEVCWEIGLWWVKLEYVYVCI